VHEHAGLGKNAYLFVDSPRQATDARACELRPQKMPEKGLLGRCIQRGPRMPAALAWPLPAAFSGKKRSRNATMERLHSMHRTLTRARKAPTDNGAPVSTAPCSLQCTESSHPHRELARVRRAQDHVWDQIGPEQRRTAVGICHRLAPAHERKRPGDRTICREGIRAPARYWGARLWRKPPKQREITISM